jgi:DNA-directed RNA polymerase subunit M/transcription elongation factor TFIIS
MPDVFQFYSSSADANPGKGTGEQLESPPSTYAELKKIDHWRRKLAEKAEGHEQILLLTKDAELYFAPPKKPRVRMEELEKIRKELLEKPKEEAQRIVESEKEMADASKVKSEKKPRTKKSKVAPSPVEETSPESSPDAVSAVPEGAVAGPPVNLGFEAPDMEKEEETSAIRFCPVCRYYLYLHVDFLKESGADDSEKGGGELYRICRNCGYNEKDEKGGLVSEILVKERSAEAYKILINEFTKKDNRLPHIRGFLKCPNVSCVSNKGQESDIIYLKDDPVNLSYIYMCNHCDFHWRSRR